MDNQFLPKDDQPSSDVDQPGATVQPGMKSGDSTNNGQPPQPFTMDSTGQSSTTPTPPPSNDSSEPNPFTMDESTAATQAAFAAKNDSTSLNEPSGNNSHPNADAATVNPADAHVASPASAPAPGVNIQPGQSSDDLTQQPNVGMAPPAQDLSGQLPAVQRQPEAPNQTPSNGVSSSLSPAQQSPS